MPEDYIYVDEGISGRHTGNRPAFQKMIQTARRQEKPFQVILLWKFSRFARNREDAILYKSMLRRECGVDVISVSEPVGDQKMSVIFEAMIEAMDEYYSLNLAEEVLRGMKEKALRGGFQTRPPFGWDKIPGGPLVVNAREAGWYACARQAFLEGKSFSTIAKMLNQQGARTKKGNAFDGRAIEYILCNPMQSGYVRWTEGKTVSKRIFDSPDTLIVKSEQVPPLITEEEFQRLQDEIKRRKRYRKKYQHKDSGKKHWLSGLLRCSACGGGLGFQSAAKGFQCQRYNKGLCGTSHFLPAAKIEVQILSFIKNLEAESSFSDGPVSSLLEGEALSIEEKNQLLGRIVEKIVFRKPDYTLEVHLWSGLEEMLPDAL